MRKIFALALFVFTIAVPFSVFAILNLELTKGVASAIPITVLPFEINGETPPHDMAAIISQDLQNSGRFKVSNNNKSKTIPKNISEINANSFQGTDSVAIGSVTALDQKRYQVSFQLVDVYGPQGKASLKIKQAYKVSDSDIRSLAHHISDLIYQALTGERGVFSTKLAYILVKRNNNETSQYTLEVADQDGFAPQPLLVSSEPIMSPAWSPDGKQLAYVSFENQRAGIYIQTASTGARQLLSHFPGINGAPAWSPDGKKLALVLSKTGAPNIYVMDIASHQLKQLTNDYYINTEPSWSPDGKTLLFTSNRAGGPQIYQINLKTKALSRVTYDGDYNARPSFTHNGKHIAMIHRVSNIYHIALLNLDTGIMKVLTTSSRDSASPSIAPNGSMILYDTVYTSGQNVLSMVSTDGRVQLVLPDRNGDAQDPAWSPYLS